MHGGLWTRCPGLKLLPKQWFVVVVRWRGWNPELDQTVDLCVSNAWCHWELHSCTCTWRFSGIYTRCFAWPSLSMFLFGTRNRHASSFKWRVWKVRIFCTLKTRMVLPTKGQHGLLIQLDWKLFHDCTRCFWQLMYFVWIAQVSF